MTETIEGAAILGFDPIIIKGEKGDPGAAADLSALNGIYAALNSPAFTGTPTLNGTPLGSGGGVTDEGY